MREENEKKRAGTFSLRTNSPDSYSPVTPNAGGKACALCRTRTSDTWYRSPKAQGVSGTVLCDSCGLNWYKYHDLTARPVRDDGQKKAGEKREGTPLATDDGCSSSSGFRAFIEAQHASSGSFRSADAVRSLFKERTERQSSPLHAMQDAGSRGLVVPHYEFNCLCSYPSKHLAGRWLLRPT
jgi:hypothetical protein